MSQQLALIALLVPEYDEGIAFFTGVLGFDLLEDSDQGGGKRWVRVAPSGGQTAFLLARAVGAQRATIGQQGGGRVWLFLQTDDFARDYALMRRAGVEFLEEPRSESYGMVVQWADPFGNKWDLLERR